LAIVFSSRGEAKPTIPVSSVIVVILGRIFGESDLACGDDGAGLGQRR
jgi:hypothetical protein